MYIRRILSILLFFNMACGTDKPKKEQQFYYYPQKNVYYDPVKKEFWYSLNGAGSWNRFADSATAEPTTLGAKVVINSEDSQVYKNNESHRKLYSGTLFTMGAKDSVATSLGPEAADRKIIVKKKITTPKKPVEEKPKKGLGKFINKIFGKHK
jgi:hypothetical protein